MTRDEMILELQSLLDEQGISTDQGFYNVPDLGLALDKAQKDILTLAVNRLVKYREANIEKIPFMLSELLETVSSTVATSENTVDLPSDFWSETNVEYSPNSTVAPQLCRKETDNSSIINRNRVPLVFHV